jgi:hypothetical protein
MATPDPVYRPVVDPRGDMERSPEQAARETALHEVEETLLNIEQAIRRADRGRKTIGSNLDTWNLKLSLDDAVTRLEAVRKELFQSAYFGGDHQRLF